MRRVDAAVVGAVVASTASVGLLGAAWVVIGPTGVVFAGVAHATLTFWAFAASGARTAPLTHPWFRVRAWEAATYRLLGVRAFGRALGAIGWNRVIDEVRAEAGASADPVVLDQQSRRSEAGHLGCLVASVALAAAALAVGEPAGAAWVAGLGVVLHLYPVMLQRRLRSRGRARSGQERR